MKAAEINKTFPSFYRGDIGSFFKKIQNVNLTLQVPEASGGTTTRFKTTATVTFAVDGKLVAKTATDPLWPISYAAVSGTPYKKCQLTMPITFKSGGGTWSKAAADNVWTLSTAYDVYTTGADFTLPQTHFARCALLLSNAAVPVAMVAWSPAGPTLNDPILPPIPAGYYHVATLLIRNGAAGANPWTAGTNAITITGGTDLGTAGTFGFEGPGAMGVTSGWHRKILFCLDASGNPRIAVGSNEATTAAAAEMPEQPEDCAVIAEGVLNPGMTYLAEWNAVTGTTGTRDLGAGGSFAVTPVMYSRGRDFTDID